jgi:hypothetical protein
MSIWVMSRGDGSVIEGSSGRLKVFIRSRDERICPLMVRVNLKSQFEQSVRRAWESSHGKKVSASFGLIVA